MEKLLCLVLAICIYNCSVEGAKVSLYSQEGKGITETLNEDRKACTTLQNDWLDKATSMYTDSPCLELYMEMKCNGTKVVVYNELDVNPKLSMYGIDKQLKSLKMCGEDVTTRTKNWNSIRLMSKKDISRNETKEMIYNVVSSCRNIDDLVFPIEKMLTYGTCVRFYSKLNCASDSEMELINPVFSNTGKYITRKQYQNIKNIRSFNLCRNPKPTTETTLSNLTTNTEFPISTTNSSFITKIISTPNSSSPTRTNSISNSSYPTKIISTPNSSSPTRTNSISNSSYPTKIISTPNSSSPTTTMWTSNSSYSTTTISTPNSSSLISISSTIKSSSNLATRSPTGTGSAKHNTNASRDSTNSSAATLILVSTMVVIFIVIVGVGYWLHRRVRQSSDLEAVGLDLQNDRLCEEFRNGNPKAFDLIPFKNADTAYRAANLPYDAASFEISLKTLQWENNSLLGAGEFVIVRKAKLVNHQKYPEPITVAVKTVKDGTDSGYIKALLDECKLMMYLRKTRHQHIVNLIGTCTENLRKLEPYIVLEYCKNGSLLSHLQRQRKCFINLVVNDAVTFPEHKDGDGNQSNAADTNDLIKWSSQIADGMHYLCGKKVVHGDLATRNIFLDNNFDAKISDVGLSRQLYQYSVDKNKTNLPWRWMAMESLQDVSFSTQSDVWAFGVTIWQVFSLGILPYPELTWTETFIQILKGGYRLEKPKFATTKMYKYNLILSCWNEVPDSRPTFESLRDAFLFEIKREERDNLI